VLQPCTSPSLRTVLERGPLSTRNAVALIVGLASAVEAFARAGLVARELNPDAVLVHRRRGAILSDYGMPPGLVGPPTVPRDAHGAYRSPEEREGRELTARSSVYSLGAILVSALTAAPAPEQLGPQQARRTRDVPPTIGSVIAQAMAADPNRRYADVTEMARAAVEVVRASDRIGRMEAPAPRKQKPSRSVRWRAAQHPATRRLSAVAPLVTGTGAGPATAPADEREEAAQRKAAHDAERREKTEHAAQRKAAQDAERREKAEHAAQPKVAQDAERREKTEQPAQRKREQAAAKCERDEAAKRARETAAQRKREAAAAKRERDEAAKREREKVAAKRKREEAAAKRKAAATREREKAAAKRKREQDAMRKAGAAAKGNGAPATRRRGATESGRQRKPRRGATAKSSAAAATSARAATRIPNLKVGLGAAQASLGRHRLPLLGIAIVAGAAGVSTLALTGGGGEAKAVPITAGEGDLSIRMPAGWERVAPPAPRLDWLSGTIGAVASDGGGAALVSGLIRDPAASRRALRALLPDGAAGKTVRLGGIEAVRYSELRLGTGLTGTAYVIHTTGPSIAMLCRGPKAVVHQCAETGATVTLRGERPVAPAVAARRPLLVRRAVRTLEAERAAGRRRVAAALVADDQAKASRGLQASYLQAAGRVDLSGAYGPRIEALSAALREASDGYGDLAESITAGDQRAYDAARAAVLEAETQVWGKSAAN
jgi:hypothetical protein